MVTERLSSVVVLATLLGFGIPAQSQAEVIATLASSWNTVDNYAHPNSVSTFSSKVLVHSSGKIYTLGDATDASGGRKWIVRESANGGKKWSVADEFSGGQNTMTMANDIIEGNDGRLIVLGFIVDLSDYSSRTIVRRSGPGSSPWSTIHDRVEPEFWLEFKLIKDAQGNLYAAGSLGDWGNLNWVVKKSTNNGVSWTEIHRYQLAPGADSWLMAAASDKAGRLYITGYSLGAEDKAWCLVQRSDDSGASWATVDQYRLNPNGSAVCYGITASYTNEVYTAGTARDATDVRHVVVRKSDSTGLNWTTVDDFTSASGSSPRTIHAGELGVYLGLVTGAADFSHNRWQVRKGTYANGSIGMTWSLSDDFAFNKNGGHSEPRSIASRGKSVYVAGFVQEYFHPDPAVGPSRWFVRKYE